MALRNETGGAMWAHSLSLLDLTPNPALGTPPPLPHLSPPSVNRTSACIAPPSFLGWRRLPPKNVARLIFLLGLMGLLLLFLFLRFMKRAGRGKPKDKTE